jgi:hypothetical protein
MESDLGMLGVPGKLAKRKNFTRPKEKIEKKWFFFTQAAQTAIDQFLVSRNMMVYQQAAKGKQPKLSPGQCTPRV